MNNINQDIQDKSELLSKNQIINKQTLALQNSDKSNPISLEVNQITDYYALSITLIVTVITSFISAFITIWLVTKSNKEMIKLQILISEKQLKQQQKEIESKHRQDWINSVRNIISEYVVISKNLLKEVVDCTNYRIVAEKNHDFVERFSMSGETLGKSYNDLVNHQMLLNLMLSKEGELDREIYNLIVTISIAHGELRQLIENDFQNGLFSTLINFEYLDKFDQKDLILINNMHVLEKTKLLLKNEWERVKSFE